MKTPNVKQLIKDVRSEAAKHSPEILMGIGIAGMIATTVLAVKVTPKAMKLIEEKKREEELDELTPVETVKTAWKCYIPTVTTGVFSIACLIGSSSVNARRNAALATAYKLSETALTEYRDKVIETIGEKKDKVIKDAIAKDKVEENPVSNQVVIITDKGNTLCYDAHSGRYFKSDIELIRKAVNELNSQMLREMYVSLNDFYDELGLDHTSGGDDLGWNLDNGLIEVEFSSQLANDSTPCIVMLYSVAPQYNYDRLLR